MFDDLNAMTTLGALVDEWLSVRAKTGVLSLLGDKAARPHLVTLGQIADLTSKELLALKNFGTESLYEVRGLLKAAGLTLADEGCKSVQKAPKGINTSLFWLAEQAGITLPERHKCDQALAKAILAHVKEKQSCPRLK